MYRTWLLLIRKPCVHAVMFFMFVDPVGAQIKQWTDKDGIVHYEGTGPITPPSSKKPSTIERSHAGYTLGEEISAFRNPNRGTSIEKAPDGAEIALFSTLPPGALSGGAYFVTGRISFIFFKYADSALGGWDELTVSTTKKYGQPEAKTNDSVRWKDSSTILIFKKKR